MDQEEEPTRLQQLVDRGALEAIVYGLKLYMLGDHCACDPGTCTPEQDCDMCMYCCGRTALRNVGEEP